MPTYEYECLKCKKTFEIFQSMKDEALTTCPASRCQMATWGEGKVKRMIGAGAGLIFKGSGFYITDYRSQGYQQAAKQDSAAKTDSGPKADGGAKTDSKVKTEGAAKAPSETKPVQKESKSSEK